jgi:hypothetical protein
MNVTNIQKPQLAPAKRRMSLDNVVQGRIKSPFRIVLYGPEKVGKSTFAAGAPSPVWLGADVGTEHLDIKRLPVPQSWRDVLEACTEVEERGLSLGFKTLVVDPIGWLEQFVHVDVTGDANVPLKTWGGGFGAGFSAAVDRWRVFIKALERVRAAGLNIILIGHATVKKFEDPEGPGYERYEIALENKAVAGVLKQWADHILFAKRESFGKVDPTSKKAKAFGSAARMLHTEWTPAYDAGNRAELPPEMPLSWDAFATALASGEKRVEELRAQIEEGLRELADAEVEQKVRAWLNERSFSIGDIANAVAAKLGEKRAQQAGGVTENKEK